MGLLDSLFGAVGAKKRDFLIDVAGDLRLTYFAPREDAPSYVTGTYSGRGVTVDLLNEKGFFDNWHPHGRVIVSLNQSRRETHIVAKKGGFYSRKLGAVDIGHEAFSNKYQLLTSNPNMAKKLITHDVASWIVNLDMQFQITGSSIVFHQDRDFKDRKRIKHIVDALVYIANAYDKMGINV